MILEIVLRVAQLAWRYGVLGLVVKGIYKGHFKATALANKRIGALVVIERNIILSRYVEVGTLLDARVSKELLLSVFHPSSPIHDGAAIIQRGRISAAGCFLPLTRDENLDANWGTRHRAAIGISQETDAIVVLVSEEGASISLVVEGKVSRKMEPKDLRKSLTDLLAEEKNADDFNQEPRAPGGFFRFFKSRGGNS